MNRLHEHRPRSQKITVRERLRLAQAKSEFYRLPKMVVTLPKAPWDTHDENETTHDENVIDKYSD